MEEMEEERGGLQLHRRGCTGSERDHNLLCPPDNATCCTCVLLQDRTVDCENKTDIWTWVQEIHKGLTSPMTGRAMLMVGNIVSAVWEISLACWDLLI